MQKPTREQMRRWLHEMSAHDVSKLLESADMTAFDVLLEYLDVKDNSEYPNAQRPVIFWNAIEHMMDRVYDIMEDEHNASRECSMCHGVGHAGEYKCFVCRGKGYVEDSNV